PGSTPAPAEKAALEPVAPASAPPAANQPPLPEPAPATSSAAPATRVTSPAPATPPASPAPAMASAAPAPAAPSAGPATERHLGFGYTGQVIGWPVAQAYAAPVSAFSLRWWSRGRLGVEADLGLAIGFGGDQDPTYALGVLLKLPIRLVTRPNVQVYF